MASEQQKVLVIGGGCAGLGTAVTLASRGVPTVLVSDEFSPLTTSDVSAGFWEPIMVKECGADAAALERTRRWSGTTFDFLTEVMHAFGTPASGCSLCSGFELLKEKNAKPHFYSDLAIGFRSLSDRDIARITNGNDYGTAFAWTTVMCDQRMYLPFLLRHFVALGGEVQQRRVSSLLEETQQYAAVVNCTGLGATDLDVGESNMLPTRGQVVKRKNRGVSHFWMTDDGPGGHCVYVLPRPDSTVVTGGTFQVGNEQRAPDGTEVHRIKEMSRVLTSSLDACEVVQIAAAPRPCRKGDIRVEVDQRPEYQGRLVHNYGHGAYGITSHMGTAHDAADLVIRCLGKTHDDFEHKKGVLPEALRRHAARCLNFERRTASL